MIARVYKFTFDQIADMTPAQQYYLLNPSGPAADSKVIHFDTNEEYEAWLTKSSLS